MATKTLGKTTTPSTPQFGWITNSTHGQVAMAFTTSESGLYTTVSFYAAGDSPLGMHGCIWDAGGNPLAFGSGVITSGGHSSGVGASQWWTDNLNGAPIFIPANTLVYLGWQTNSASTVSWAYNGNDHSPNAIWANNWNPSSEQGLGGNQLMSPSGAVAVYATYTPTSAYVERGGNPSSAQGVYVTRNGGQSQSQGVFRYSAANGWVMSE